MLAMEETSRSQVTRVKFKDANANPATNVYLVFVKGHCRQKERDCRGTYRGPPDRTTVKTPGSSDAEIIFFVTLIPVSGC